MTAADILITNARVLTMDPARPRAEALAIKGARILRAGSKADVAGFKAKHTRVIDAGMKTVMISTEVENYFPATHRTACSTKPSMPGVCSG